MGKATNLMDIDGSSSSTQSRAFAKDILSVEIEGPQRPQLTLVDLPGLIQNETKGVTKADVELVKEITDYYIAQHRTICLAVVAATNDYANQGILTKVRDVDKEGERTLGIVTKPDRLDPGSGSESSFLSLARNGDVFFKLGWHVLKNRSFEETASSFLERNLSETAYFRKSNFKILPKSDVGIDALRDRLSKLLFAHVKEELPKLREDLATAMIDSTSQLTTMGKSRATSQECKAYLVQLSLEYYEICKAAVDGHYEGHFFEQDDENSLAFDSPVSVRRLRSVVQYLNLQFSELLRERGHKYHIDKSGTAKVISDPSFKMPKSKIGCPAKVTNSEALTWVHQVLLRTRGRELPGNYNPLLVGELFWEQSSYWHEIANQHLETVALLCSKFLEVVHAEKCSKDIRSRLWSSLIQDALKSRLEAASRELKLVMEDVKNYPINYNHYYTDTISKQRQSRNKTILAECVDQATSSYSHFADGDSKTVDTNLAIEKYSQHIDPNMEKHSCQEALDCLLSIYKV